MNAWDVFWFLFLFIPLCILWVIVLFDVIGRNDMVGWQKAIWAMVIIFFPWIGVFAYLIVRPRHVTVPPYPGASAPASPTYTREASPTAVPTPVSGDARGATS